LLSLLLAIPILTTWGYFRERALRKELQTAYSHERELREQNEEIVESQRKLLTFIVNTDTVRDYWNRVEAVARDQELLESLESALANPELSAIRQNLNKLPQKQTESQALRQEFIEHGNIARLQAWVEALHVASQADKVFAWFLQGPQGLQLARSPFEKQSVGHNYARRAYFHGGDEDYENRADFLENVDDPFLRETRLSTPFLTESTNEWVVAVSAPVVREGVFLGVVGVFLYIERPAPGGK
jgi:hypothetical protein